jgi:hypothetical protein
LTPESGARAVISDADGDACSSALSQARLDGPW